MNELLGRTHRTRARFRVNTLPEITAIAVSDLFANRVCISLRFFQYGELAAWIDERDMMFGKDALPAQLIC